MSDRVQVVVRCMGSIVLPYCSVLVVHVASIFGHCFLLCIPSFLFSNRSFINFDVVFNQNRFWFSPTRCSIRQRAPSSPHTAFFLFARLFCLSRLPFFRALRGKAHRGRKTMKSSLLPLRPSMAKAASSWRRNPTTPRCGQDTLDKCRQSSLYHRTFQAWS